MIDQPNDPQDPMLLSTLNRMNVGIDAHSPHNPLIRGNLLFLSWYEAGIQVFNIADPANPVHVGAFDTYVGTSTSYNGAWGVYPMLGLDKVLIGDRQRGLIIVDATELLSPGDYTQDGVVDTADYTVWRDMLGQTGPGLAADATGNDLLGIPDGVVDQFDYDFWRAHFGETAPPGSGAGAAVPEPATLIMLLVGMLAMFFRRRTAVS